MENHRLTVSIHLFLASSFQLCPVSRYIESSVDYCVAELTNFMRTTPADKPIKWPFAANLN